MFDHCHCQSIQYHCQNRCLKDGFIRARIQHHEEIKSNILYSDKNIFIWLPQLHIAGLLYSGCEPPISLLPKSHYNLCSLLISLDQGHIEIVVQSMVHVCECRFVYSSLFECAQNISPKSLPNMGIWAYAKKMGYP